jgi:hypothetical protein
MERASLPPPLRCSATGGMPWVARETSEAALHQRRKRRAKNFSLDTPSDQFNTVRPTNSVASVQGPDRYVILVIIDRSKAVGTVNHPCRF